ncbi:hypothetical protein RI367_002095 [Sorochytrium milnesiophthora]
MSSKAKGSTGKRTNSNTKLSHDMAGIRGHFPALSEHFAFLENAGGSQCLAAVGDRVQHFLYQTNVHASGTRYYSRLAHQALARVFAGLEAIQKFFNAPTQREIVVGPASTALTKAVSESLELVLRESISGDRDEIIVTNIDHEANINPWIKLGQRRAITVKMWEVNKKTMHLEMEDLEKLLTKNTRLVAMSHCSNVIGQVNDIKTIAARVHQIPGAEIFVDGVAFAPHRHVDVQDLGVDYYVVSFYKIFGPHMSGMYIKQSALDRLGNSAYFFSEIDEIPRLKVMPGGLSYELTYSITALVEYLHTIGAPDDDIDVNKHAVEDHDCVKVTPADVKQGYDVIVRHEKPLIEKLLKYLESKPDMFSVVGPKRAEERVGIISFFLKNHSHEDCVDYLDQHANVLIAAGRFHAVRLMESLGVDEHGVMRISFCHYNTEEEIDSVIKHLDAYVTGTDGKMDKRVPECLQ